MKSSVSSSNSQRGWFLKLVITGLFLYGFFSPFALLTKGDRSGLKSRACKSNSYEDQNNRDAPDFQDLTQTLQRNRDELRETKSENSKLVLELRSLKTKLVFQNRQTSQFRYLLGQAQKDYTSRKQDQNPPSSSSRVTYEPLDFIQLNDLHVSDYMADCWLMQKERFLDLKPPPEIAGTLTGFTPKMFVDWTSFAME